jgi:hypothetical protein
VAGASRPLARASALAPDQECSQGLTPPTFAGRADLAVRLKDAGLAPDQLPAVKALLDALLLAGFGRDLPVPTALPATQALLALYAYAFTAGVAASLLLTGAACVAMALLVWIVLEPAAPAADADAAPLPQAVVLESPL